MADNSAEVSYERCMHQAHHALNKEEHYELHRIINIADTRIAPTSSRSNPATLIASFRKMHDFAGEASKKFREHVGSKMIHPLLPPQLQQHRVRLALELYRPGQMGEAVFANEVRKAIIDTEVNVLLQFMNLEMIRVYAKAGLEKARLKVHINLESIRRNRASCEEKEKATIEGLATIMNEEEIATVRQNLEAIRADIRKMTIIQAALEEEERGVEEVAERAMDTYGILVAYQHLCKVHGSAWLDHHMKLGLQRQWSLLLPGQYEHEFVDEKMVLSNPWITDADGYPKVKAGQPSVKVPRPPPKGTFKSQKPLPRIRIQPPSGAVSQGLAPRDSLNVLPRKKTPSGAVSQRLSPGDSLSPLLRKKAAPKSRLSTTTTVSTRGGYLSEETLPKSIRPVSENMTAAGGHKLGAASQQAVAGAQPVSENLSLSNSRYFSTSGDEAYQPGSEALLYGEYLMKRGRKVYKSPYAPWSQIRKADAQFDKDTRKRVRRS